VRRIALAVAAAIAGLSTVVLGPISPASAEDADCTPYVLDHTKSQLLSGHMGAINAGVAKMTALGANVRVRVEEGFPEGAGQYIDAMQAKCGSWRGADGRLDKNMVVIVYATSVNGDYAQRPARIRVGSRWGLDDKTLNKLIVDNMRPNLLKYNKDDQSTWPDVAAGITAGENALADKMKPYNYWPWIIGGVICVFVIVGLAVWLSGRGGRYSRGTGGNYYGGSTFISPTHYSGSSGGGFSSGGDSGSVNC
jgi:hypothetical protein